jgi:hypothetical protein
MHRNIGMDPIADASEPCEASGLASCVTAPLPVVVSILDAGERRDHIVRIGGHRDDVIVAELDQCVALGIGLPDAADLRRVDNDRLSRSPVR